MQCASFTITLFAFIFSLIKSQSKLFRNFGVVNHAENQRGVACMLYNRRYRQPRWLSNTEKTPQINSSKEEYKVMMKNECGLDFQWS